MNARLAWLLGGKRVMMRQDVPGVKSPVDNVICKRSPHVKLIGFLHLREFVVQCWFKLKEQNIFQADNWIVSDLGG